MGLGSFLPAWWRDGVCRSQTEGSPQAVLLKLLRVQLAAWTYWRVKLGRGLGRWRVIAVRVRHTGLGSAVDQTEAAGASAQQSAKFPSFPPFQSAASEPIPIPQALQAAESVTVSQ